MKLSGNVTFRTVVIVVHVIVLAGIFTSTYYGTGPLLGTVNQFTFAIKSIRAKRLGGELPIIASRIAPAHQPYKGGSIQNCFIKQMTM